MPITLSTSVSNQDLTMNQSIPSSPSTSTSSFTKTYFSNSKRRSVSSFDSQHSDDYDNDSDSPDSRPSLHQVLLNQGHGRYTLDNFAAFLHSQFSYENLAFWLSARQYKLCAQSLYRSVIQSSPEFNLHVNSMSYLTPSQARQFSELQRKMSSIINTFVLPNSPHELNLSDSVRCKLLKVVAEGNYHPMVLDQAKEAIMDLMKCSSYPMFVEDIANKRNSALLASRSHQLTAGPFERTFSSSSSQNSDSGSSHHSWKFKAKHHLKLVSKMLKKSI